MIVWTVGWVEPDVKWMMDDGDHYQNLRGAVEKKVTKSGKSPKGGDGSAQKIKKSIIRNLDFLIRGGEEAIVSFFFQM